MIRSEAVQNQLRKAIAAHNLILELHPEGTFKDTTRNKMFHALCDLVTDHFGAIILLVKTSQHDGSAFALLRPLMETCIRAFWVLYIAEEAELISIANSDQGFPGFDTARLALENFFQEGKLKLFRIDKAVVRTLHGFTHSGLEQIVNRYDSNHGILPTYRENDVLELLNQAARFAIMAALEVIQQIEGSPEKPSPKAKALVERFLQIANN